MTTKITIRGHFHGTTVRAVVANDGSLSARQIRRISRELCGMVDCHCGGLARAKVDGGGEIVLLRMGDGALYLTREERLAGWTGQ